MVVDYLRRDGLAFLHDIAHIADPLSAELRDVNEPFDVVVELYESTIFHNLDHRNLYDLTDREPLLNGGPWIITQLLDTEGESLALGIDIQYDSVDLITDVVHLFWIGCTAGPGQIRYVNETVDTLVEADEETEVRYVLDLSNNLGSFWIFLLDNFPGVVLGLLHTERDATCFQIDLKNNGPDFVANLKHLRWMLDAACPGHLGDMNQTFDTRLKLNERAVICDRNDLTRDQLVLRVMIGDVRPRVLLDLLETKRDTFTFFIKLKNDDLYLITHLEHLRRMIDSAPGHIRNMK